MDYNQNNRGFAYVSYVNQKDNAYAMRRLNGMKIAANHRLELFQCRDLRTFYLCNVANHFTRWKMYQTVVHLTSLGDGMSCPKTVRGKHALSNYVKLCHRIARIPNDSNFHSG
uniref:RRM domain-containing protein n=1 Tax=Anopheles maculatus TaxID=74869 RepID=A0A182S6C5_9DIPT